MWNAWENRCKMCYRRFMPHGRNDGMSMLHLHAGSSTSWLPDANPQKQLSPFEILCGRKPRISLDALMPRGAHPNFWRARQPTWPSPAGSGQIILGVKTSTGGRTQREGKTQDLKAFSRNNVQIRKYGSGERSLKHAAPDWPREQARARKMDGPLDNQEHSTTSYKRRGGGNGKSANFTQEGTDKPDHAVSHKNPRLTAPDDRIVCLAGSLRFFATGFSGRETTVHLHGQKGDLLRLR